MIWLHDAIQHEYQACQSSMKTAKSLVKNMARKMGSASESGATAALVSWAGGGVLRCAVVSHRLARHDDCSGAGDVHSYHR